MTLQQLRYVLEVTACGSITAAANKLYIAQPSISKAISDLEQEMGISIFKRTFYGSQLTDDGARFVELAHQVVENADRLEASYKGSFGPRPTFEVAAAHNSLVTHAFGEVARSLDSSFYELSLRGGEVADITERVRTHRADVGVLYRSHENAEAVEAFIDSNGLRYRPLAAVPVFVLIGTNNPLAQRPSLRLDDLENLPCVEQRPWYGDRVHPVRRLFSLPNAARRIVVADGIALHHLIVQLGGYSLGVGSLRDESFHNDLVRIPLEDVGLVEICLLTHPSYPLSPAAREFSVALKRVALASEGGCEPKEQE